MKHWRWLRRAAKLSTIILLHVGLFYVLQSGSLREAAQAVLPKEVFVTFQTPKPTLVPEPPIPQPTPRKAVPVVKKTVIRPRVIPPVNDIPSERAITLPPAPAQLPEPVDQEPAAAPPAPPAPVARPAAPKTIASGVEYLQPPRPEYPAASRRRSEEGQVTLRVLINQQGRPEQVDIHKTSGSPLLDEAARQALLRTVFKPHTEDSNPVAVYAIVPITFQLDR